jgi:single-stranded DNA-binding protein
MRRKEKVANTLQSTLMYIEAEAKMDSFQAQDGTQRTALNLLQRML